MFTQGQQIIYIPDHADNDQHPDCELGFVTSWRPEINMVYCRFWRKGKPGVMRTIHNSEGCTPRNVHPLVENVIDPGLIECILAFIKSETPITAWCDKCKAELNWKEVPGHWRWSVFEEAWKHVCL